jgi:hypothetical protein
MPGLVTTTLTRSESIAVSTQTISTPGGEGREGSRWIEREEDKVYEKGTKM